MKAAAQQPVAEQAAVEKEAADQATAEEDTAGEKQAAEKAAPSTVAQCDLPCSSAGCRRTGHQDACVQRCSQPPGCEAPRGLPGA